MKPGKGIEPDRCTTEPLNRAVVASALSIWQWTEHELQWLQHAALQYKPPVQSGSLRSEQLFLPTAHSPSFLLTFLLSCAHSHTDASSFSFYSFTRFFFPFATTPPPTSAHFWAAFHRHLRIVHYQLIILAVLLEPGR